jgi:hypothetical protein
VHIHSLICISYRKCEIHYCSLFISFMDIILRDQRCGRRPSKAHRLEAEKEGPIIAAQDQNLAIRSYNHQIIKDDADPQCRICGKHEYSIDHIISWLIDWWFTVLNPAHFFPLIWRRHHCRWRPAKFCSMLGAQGLWTRRELYCATPVVTHGLGYSGLIRRTAPFSCLVRHTRGCGGSILTRILMGVPN